MKFIGALTLIKLSIMEKELMVAGLELKISQPLTDQANQWAKVSTLGPT